MAARQTRFLDLVSGRLEGFHFEVARAFLSLCSAPYRLAIAIRNAYYDAVQSKTRAIARPVISVGNITVGGTGKTPVSIHIANLLADRGARVAILTRGYKGRPIQVDPDGHDEAAGAWRGESDEALVLRQRCPDAEVIVGANRVAGARRAIEKRADVLILDDGFQHRRLQRNLDIVLIDATEPFGYGYMLPRGLLREPLRSLRRADIIILTRSDQVDESRRRVLTAQLHRTSGGKPVVQAIHRVGGFTDLKGRSVAVEDLAAIQAVIFAGIANFGSFQQCVEGLGIRVLAAYEYPDHHDYTGEEIAALSDVADNLEANAILATEKDAVKLVGRWSDEHCRLLIPQLNIEFDEEGDRILRDAIDRILSNA